MKTKEELLRSFPYPITFTFGGPCYILVWYSYNEGQRLIVGKTLSAIKQAVDRRNEKFGDFELKELFQGTIVKPGINFQTQYQTQQLKHLLSAARTQIAYPIQDYQVEFGSLPPHCSWCKKFESKYDEDEDDRHYNCINCTYRVVIDVDPLILMNWHLSQHPERFTSRNKNLFELDIPVQNPDLPLYHFTGGNSQSYSMIEEGHIFANEGFFFQGKSLEIPPDWLKEIEQYQTNRQEARKKQHQEDRAQRVREEREELENIKKFLENL